MPLLHKGQKKTPAPDAFAMHRGSFTGTALRSQEDDPARVEFLEELRLKRLAKAKPEGWPDEGEGESRAA